MENPIRIVGDIIYFNGIYLVKFSSEEEKNHLLEIITTVCAQTIELAKKEVMKIF